MGPPFAWMPLQICSGTKIRPGSFLLYWSHKPVESFGGACQVIIWTHDSDKARPWRTDPMWCCRDPSAVFFDLTAAAASLQQTGLFVPKSCLQSQRIFSPGLLWSLALLKPIGTLSQSDRSCQRRIIASLAIIVDGDSVLWKTGSATYFRSDSPTVVYIFCRYLLIVGKLLPVSYG